ncbi:MAG TPA: SH3 domain-containing protein [Stellaceae bacterium]|nr:SH3 domain-containing protein [Stellaceae bacterium]
MARRKWVRAVAGLGLALASGVWWEAIAAAVGGAEAPLPHFASLHSDKVNLRAGPGDRYPVEWVYVRKDWPVEVVAQFDHWRRVRDWAGTEGWVHEKMVAGRREVIVIGGVRALRTAPDLAAALVARAEPGVVARLDECRGGWCRIVAGDVTGWVERSNIWGVYPTEAVP